MDNPVGLILVQKYIYVLSDKIISAVFELGGDKFKNNSVIEEAIRNRNLNIEEDNLKKKSIGQLYYNLAVETLNGKSQKLSDYIKSSDYDYTYLKFWASFCSPSMKEFKFLKENIDKYKHIRIISISIDDNEQSWIKSAKKTTYLV